MSSKFKPHNSQFKIQVILYLIKETLKNRFIIFLIVGGINTLFGYGIFCLFIFIGINYAVAALLATVCGVLFNFKTYGKIVFRSNDNKLIFRFFIVYGILYLFGVTILTILKPYYSIYLIQAVFLIPMALLSFLMNKNMVFKS